MHSVWQDLRYAVRQLIGNLGFTLTALLSLACGIAATTAVFSVVWAVVVQPYPYTNSERMVHLAIGDLADSGRYNGFAITVPQWEQLRTLPAIEDSILTNETNLTLTGQDLPDAEAGRVDRAEVGAGLPERERDRVAHLVGHLRAARSVEERETAL